MHASHLMNVEQLLSGCLALRPSQPTWAVSVGGGACWAYYRATAPPLNIVVVKAYSLLYHVMRDTCFFPSTLIYIILIVFLVWRYLLRGEDKRKSSWGRELGKWKDGREWWREMRFKIKQWKEKTRKWKFPPYYFCCFCPPVAVSLPVSK